MLGLRPRLKARNSLWDLVNKHSPDLHSSSPTSLKQPVEEGADGLPPLSFPSSFSSPQQNPHHNLFSESSTSFTMAPVSSTTSIALWAPIDQANGSQRKIRKGRGRRLEESSMVRLQWSRVLDIHELRNADCRLPQDLSSPSQGMLWTRKTHDYTF